MSPRPTRLLAVAAAACAAGASLTIPVAASAAAASDTATRSSSFDTAVVKRKGPDRLPPTELVGEHGPVTPMKDQAQIAVSYWGIRYQAGQQNSRLRITEVDGKLRYADPGTKRWRKLPSNCVAEPARRGIAALCSIPAQFENREMFLEVWPRLGNDSVDASAISSRYRMWVLADAGVDTVRTGAGDDFVNGAQNRDQVWGGAGDDWLRSGLANDRVDGGDGNDWIVGADADDVLYGGAGDDRVYGGPGNDSISSDAGSDSVVGGPGRDSAVAESTDRVVQCETVRRPA